MRFVLFLALVAAVYSAEQVGSEYYVGFTDTIGIDTPMNEENLECIKGISAILYDVKQTLESDYRDVDALIEAAIEFVDRMYFEIGSTCKVFVGEFETFMQEYTGGTEAVREEIENNLDNHHSRISREIHCGLIANTLDQEHDGGSLHANVFRTLLGLTANDIPISTAVLEEEKRVNEEMRSESDRTHLSVKAPKGVVDSDILSANDSEDEDEDDSEIETYVDMDAPYEIPQEIDFDEFGVPRESIQLRNLQEL